jgi:hypothetical protein
MKWNHLGAVEPQDLKPARLNLHFAAQVVSGVGRTLLPAQQDDSHTSLVWQQRQGALVSQPVNGNKPFRAALHLERFRLMVLDLDENVLFESALAGKTVDQAYSWLSGAITSQLGQEFPGFKPLHYEMPEHPLAGAGAFSFEPAAPFAELSLWYGNAESVLEELRRKHGSTAVRCWPHHFDIATLIKLGDEKSIGVGLSPGDRSYDEPYWYVGPWPHPTAEHWPSLDGGGRWHTDGFLAAVLPADDFVRENNQPKRLSEFLSSAISASKLLLT